MRDSLPVPREAVHVALVRLIDAPAVGAVAAFDQLAHAALAVFEDAEVRLLDDDGAVRLSDRRGAAPDVVLSELFALLDLPGVRHEQHMHAIARGEHLQRVGEAPLRLGFLVRV